jgi:hypothetical protein
MKRQFQLSLPLLLLVALPSPSRTADYQPKNLPATSATKIVARIQGDREEGRRVELRLSSKLHVTLAVEGPLLPAGEADLVESNDKWKVVRASTPRVEGSHWAKEVWLDPQEPGEISLQLLPIIIGGERYDWAPIIVRVTTDALADVGDLRDIAPPESLPGTSSALPWLAAAAWLLLLAAGLVTLSIRYRRQRHKPVFVLPEQWAFQELGRAEAQWASGSAEEDGRHTLLSSIIRQYLERRYSLPASKQTTPEFLEAMRASPFLAEEQQMLLREFLEQCDLVKFAGAARTAEESRRAGTMARRIVEITTTAVEPAKAAR